MVSAAADVDATLPFLGALGQTLELLPYLHVITHFS